MTLTPPKRLFNVTTMTTVLYDVADDVKDKGYVAVSHVWGDQEMYTASELGIKSGVDWKVPLSDSNKMSRLKNAMTYFKKEYCWFDVLCMPQNKQDEINLEIPLMGDYYSGADMTFILSDKKYVISADLEEWYRMASNALSEQRDLALEEYVQELQFKCKLLDIDDEPWFERVWTFQEAVLSRDLIIVDLEGKYLNLSNIFDKLSHLNSSDSGVLHTLFPERLIYLSSVVNDHRKRALNLVKVVSDGFTRRCHKPHDRFYGVLGILGYKNFVVNYGMTCADINREMVRHAYYRGDMSWLSVGNSVATGFIQQTGSLMHHVGEFWKEEVPGVCDITFESDTFCIKAMLYATITNYKKVRRYDSNLNSLVIHTLAKWRLKSEDIASTILGFDTDIDLEFAKAWVDSARNNLNEGDQLKEMYEIFGKASTFKHGLRMIRGMLNETGTMFGLIIAEATQDGTNNHFPLIIRGNVSIGDKVMLTRMYDRKGRTLGIITSKSFERKGVCLYKRVEAPEHLYVSHKFLIQCSSLAHILGVLWNFAVAYLDTYIDILLCFLRKFCMGDGMSEPHKARKYRMT